LRTPQALAGVRSQMGLLANRRIITSATCASRTASTTEAATIVSGIGNPASADASAGSKLSCQSSAPCASHPSGCSINAHFSRVLPRSSSSLMRDVP